MVEPSPEGTCCPSDKLYLSREEEAVLARMRLLSHRARELVARVREEPSGSVRARIENEINDLRQEFNAARQDLRAANVEKLRRLGHEP